MTAVPAVAQTRTVDSDRLLVIETTKGRVLVELAPEVAPLGVERVQTLARAHFYDGLLFHRVIPDFMAQTGDPQGTGQGGSDLPDLAPEFTFRRARTTAFTPLPTTGQPQGLFGVLPVRTQPDAQMMITADNRVPATVLYCPGVVGMARTQDPNTANSQFFLMTGTNNNLSGQYTAVGRVVAGMDVVRNLKRGDGDDGAVTDPDRMTRVRLASDLPEGERPTVTVEDLRAGAGAQRIIEAQARAGARFTACDVEINATVEG